MKLDVISVIKILNELKKKHKLKDYAIFGAVAASYYMEPIYTQDLDILVLAQTDADYLSVWREIKKYSAEIKEFGFIINETEVQILPTSIDPLYEDAVKTGIKFKVNRITTKVVDIEHLILMALKANRVKDRFRAKILLEQSNFDYIDSLLRKFDKDEILKKRLSTL